MSSVMAKNLTISSHQIALLTGSRHDSVKRSIGRLAKKGTIPEPPLVDGAKSFNGVIEKEYRLPEWDSYIVVSHLSPKRILNLVEEWKIIKGEQQRMMESRPLASQVIKEIAPSINALRETFPGMSETQLQTLAGDICEIDLGRRLIPYPEEVVEHSAIEMADKYGITSSKFLNYFKVKEPEYGNR